MLRSLILVTSLLLAAACASVPSSHDVVASSEPHEATEEIECMIDCLADGTENCDSCARSCLFDGPEPVASITARNPASVSR